jgi:hypothetical protein
MILLTFHLSLALALFFLVNWIGKYAIDFGYSSTTLFEEPIESVALNFFLRAMSPAVFLIAVSAICVGFEHPEFRIGIFWVSIYYYVLRAIVIFGFNRQRLVSWFRYGMHACFGITIAILAYRHLILPNMSLIPDLNQAGNELWLAIIAFLYAVANKINLPEGPGARRRNLFVKLHYEGAIKRFGTTIDNRVHDDLLKLITYSIIIYEDYARPKAFRFLENLVFWKEVKTTGIMQVSSKVALSDDQSVKEGTSILLASWKKHKRPKHLLYEKVRATIGDYNKDEIYIDKVMQLMEILAIRVEPKFKKSYSTVWPV